MKPERWRTPVAGVISGVLFALAFPPYELPLLAPVALVPWIVALTFEERRFRGLLSGFLFGMAYWIVSIPWIVYVVTRFGGQSKAMGVLSLVILAMIVAEWPTVVGWATVAIAPARSVRRLAVFPFLWLASEHVRANVYRGFPWNLTAESLYRHPVWLQTASFWGAYGVGFLVAAVSALLAAAIVRRRVRPLLAAATVVLLAGLLGAVRLVAPRDTGKGKGNAISVALLQPNISQELRLLEERRAANYAAVLQQAREAAARHPDLIVIPESALPVYWETSQALRRDLTDLVKSCNCAVLFNDIDIETNDRYFNAARLLTPRGMGEPYRKVHLVPFGEYVPLPRIFFFVRQVSTEIGEFSAAREPTVLRGDGLSIGTGVCYEILYPVLSWKQVRGGANLLVTISNDSWYGAGGAQAQHFAGAVLRAVENERYLLRAAITGISGIADERGRILSEIPADRKGTASGTVRLFATRTPWTRYGFAFSGICDAVSGGVLLFGLVRWRSERRERKRR